MNAARELTLYPMRGDVDETQRAIGLRLKAAREATGMTQKAVSKLLDLNPATISKHEHGEMRVRQSTLDDYARLYRVPSAAILYGQEVLKIYPDPTRLSEFGFLDGARWTLQEVETAIARIRDKAGPTARALAPMPMSEHHAEEHPTVDNDGSRRKGGRNRKPA